MFIQHIHKSEDMTDTVVERGVLYFSQSILSEIRLEGPTRDGERNRPLSANI